MVRPMINDVNVKISYIHSVQKTPVEEFLKIERFGKITLYETHYQSFGVGLPFSAKDGEFHQEGNVYVLKMQRELKDLALRVGKDTKLALTVDDEYLPLYEIMNVGQRVTIYVRPYMIGEFLE